MTLPLLRLVETSGQPVRRAVRRLRWFKASFKQHLAYVSQSTGTGYDVNESALTACFVNWLRLFEAQKPAAVVAHQAYIGFAAGLMLQSLIRHKPIAVCSIPPDADPRLPAVFWPEGYAYVGYCLNIQQTILEQDFDEHLDLAPELLDVKVWWSFKENCREDDALAIAFLELFSGHAPNWVAPSWFNESRARQEQVASAKTPKISSGA